MADALFSRTQQRVLGLLFGSPEQTFFGKEIIRRTASGSGAVQRELARLEESGLVVVSRRGNQKHYQANRASPVFDELRGLVLKTSGLVEPLRSALAPLSDRILLAFVYGSVARGEDRADSDIDVLIVGDDLTLEDLYARLAPVEKLLGRQISPTLYTRDEYRRRQARGTSFLKSVLKGQRLSLMGDADALEAAR